MKRFNQPATYLTRLALAGFLIACLGVVGWLWDHERRQIEAEATARFRATTAEVVDHTADLLASHTGVLRAIRGLFSGSEQVSQREWRQFLRSFDIETNYPAARSVAFIARVAPDGPPLPLDDGGEAGDAPPRPFPELGGGERLIVTHAGPAEGAAVARGFELALTAPGTLLAAAEADRPVVTAPSGLTTQGTSPADLLQLLPIYRPDLPADTAPQRRAALTGWAALDFSAKGVFTEVLDHPAGSLRLRVYDGEGPEAPLLFDSAPSASDARLTQETAFDAGGRTWRFRFDASPEFERQLFAGHFRFSAAGLAVSLALWLAAVVLVGARARALELADSLTAAFRESEARYRALFEGNRAVELLIDPADGGIVDANRAAAQFYGYPRERLTRMAVSAINTLSPEEVAAELSAAREERRNHFHFRHRLASGEIREVEVHSGPLVVNGRELLYSIVHDITERHRAEAALKASEHNYRSVVETAAEGYWRIDADTHRTTEVNGALCRILGYDRQTLLGLTPLDLVADEESRETLLGQFALIDSTDERRYELALRHGEGRLIYVQMNASTVRDEHGRAVAAFSFLSDITPIRQAAEERRLAASFFEQTSEGIMVTDADNRIVAVNPAFSRITGYAQEEAVGRTPALLNAGRHDADFYARMWQALEQSGCWQGEIWNRRRSGEIYPEWLSIVVIRNEHGRVQQYMAIFSDITTRKRDEERVWRHANYDAVTGLPNRRLFIDRLDQAIHHSRREKRGVGLMFIDLDRFKWVNDTLGHSAGDLLLAQAAERLSEAVRSTDTVARLGGDEFTVILPGVEGARDLEVVATKVMQRLAEPFILSGQEAFISASIGITLHPRDGDTAEILLKNADTAMYRAKEAGRDAYRFFTQEMNDRARTHLTLQNELRRALMREEFEVWFQPIQALASGEVVGAEALVRWRHPERGLVSPAEFIPVAEEIGLIVPLDAFVLERAAGEARRWRGQGRALFVSVNLSSLECRNRDCAAAILEAIARFDLPASALRVEITERLMMDDTERTLAMLRHLRAEGVGIAVDDFGTGYSSLSYLKRFPVNGLKIDASFVAGLPLDADDAVLVEAIVALAHSLKLTVVAEGVETQAQLDFLKRVGCDAAQGYLLGRPAPPQAFLRTLEGEPVLET